MKSQTRKITTHKVDEDQVKVHSLSGEDGFSSIWNCDATTAETNEHSLEDFDHNGIATGNEHIDRA